MKKFLLAILTLSALFALSNACLATPILNLPSDLVEAHYSRDGYPATASYWTVTLSGVPSGFDVTNGSYTGWCVDKFHSISSGNHWMTLYNTYGQLPSYAQNIPWGKVNYILNHKLGNNQDVQQALWYIVDNWRSLSDLTTFGQQMVLNAHLFGANFVPNKGEIVAVLLDPGSTNSEVPEQLKQLTIIETVDPVPEPGTLMLLGTGLVGIAGYGKLKIRRRKKVV